MERKVGTAMAFQCAIMKAPKCDYIVSCISHDIWMMTLDHWLSQVISVLSARFSRKNYIGEETRKRGRNKKLIEFRGLMLLKPIRSVGSDTIIKIGIKVQVN